MNSWLPDTCRCRIGEVYSPNPNDPENLLCERTFLTRCKDHLDTVNAADVYVETKTKNFMEGHLLENLPNHVELITATDGSQVKQWKPGVKYEWSFDKDRNLEVNITGGDAISKVSLDTLVKQKTPTAKVK